MKSTCWTKKNRCNRNQIIKTFSTINSVPRLNKLYRFVFFKNTTTIILHHRYKAYISEPQKKCVAYRTIRPFMSIWWKNSANKYCSLMNSTLAILTSMTTWFLNLLKHDCIQANIIILKHFSPKLNQICMKVREIKLNIHSTLRLHSVVQQILNHRVPSFSNSSPPGL